MLYEFVRVNLIIDIDSSSLRGNRLKILPLLIYIMVGIRSDPHRFAASGSDPIFICNYINIDSSITFLVLFSRNRKCPDLH